MITMDAKRRCSTSGPSSSALLSARCNLRFPRLACLLDEMLGISRRLELILKDTIALNASAFIVALCTPSVSNSEKE